MSTLSQRIKHRRDTGANWTSENPVLAAGELGIETDAASLRGKYGDGVATWSTLPYTELGQQPGFDAIQFDVAAGVNPITDGQLAWNADEGTLELGKGGISNYIGQETMVLCRNASNTVTIPKGTAVMFAGTVGASGRLKVAPMVSNGTFPGYVFFGVTDQPILGAEDGYVSVFGKIDGVNTSAYEDGDILWCDPAVAGGFTKIEPQAPNLKLAVAAVIRAGNNGTIFVRWTTGARLQDLHDVEANGSKEEGDVLSWNNSTNRWENQAPVNGSASRSVTIAGPLQGDSFTLFRTTRQTTLKSVVALVSGGSVTYELRYAEDRTLVGTLATVSTTATSTTTGDIATVQNQPIAANRYVWIQITAVTGTVNEFNLSVAF